MFNDIFINMISIVNSAMMVDDIVMNVKWYMVRMSVSYVSIEDDVDGTVSPIDNDGMVDNRFAKSFVV